MCLFVAALRSVRDQDFWPGTRCSSSFAGQCEARRSQLRPHLDLSGAALSSLPTPFSDNIFKISLCLTFMTRWTLSKVLTFSPPPAMLLLQQSHGLAVGVSGLVTGSIDMMSMQLHWLTTTSPVAVNWTSSNC